MKDFEEENQTGESADKLTANQETALAALLAQGTVAAAAAACGLSETTIWRYQQLPAFQDRYRQARAQLVETTIAQLQSAGTLAVETLCAVARDETAAPGARIAAARAILAGGLRGLDLTLEAEEAATHLHGCANMDTCGARFHCRGRDCEEFILQLCPKCKGSTGASSTALVTSSKPH